MNQAQSDILNGHTVSELRSLYYALYAQQAPVIASYPAAVDAGITVDMVREQLQKRLCGTGEVVSAPVFELTVPVVRRALAINVSRGMVEAIHYLQDCGIVYHQANELLIQFNNDIKEAMLSS